MKKTLIIAEVGVNHNGSLELAKLLVDKAVEAGADIVKFQTFVASKLVTRNAEKADYQKKQTGNDESQYSMLKKLELSYSEFVEIKNYCIEKDIEFLSTAFDSDSVEFLDNLGLSRWKIPSGEITNLPYLKEIAQKRKPILLSTGMSTMEEISAAIFELRKYGATDITVLHCTTEYPAPFNEVNLLAIKAMSRDLGIPIGYSDHTNGIEVAIAAAALGAIVVEKHFTLDRNMNGPDHSASIESEELGKMITSIRNVDISLGYEMKLVSKSEEKNKLIARKSIFASTKIFKGELFSENNITAKRPGSGINPMRWFEVIGKTAIRDFAEDEMIEI
jgi:N,N'-diacetyllegionaminate synthase